MIHTGKIAINGIEIREKIVGDGAPVLMVHGWGASIDLLEPLAQRLSRLGHQCFMFDLPGFGESDEPTQPFTIYDYADFCLEYLNRHGLTAAHFFGHSLGGRIGLILAADYCKHISTMVLSNSAGIRVEPAFPTNLRLRVYKSIRDSLEIAGAKATADRLRKIYNDRYGSVDYQSASPVMRQTLVNVVNQDLLDCAKRVTVPTVLIWGDEDRDTPLCMGRMLEEAVADAALIVHPGAGHYAYLDFPDKTAGIMDALYRSV